MEQVVTKRMSPDLRGVPALLELLVIGHVKVRQEMCQHGLNEAKFRNGSFGHQETVPTLRDFFPHGAVLGNEPSSVKVWRLDEPAHLCPFNTAKPQREEGPGGTRSLAFVNASSSVRSHGCSTLRRQLAPVKSPATRSVFLNHCTTDY